ncbi:MAG: OmpA family protein [Methanohalobium sp.]|uniref:OmpA family protein n=1 Tax=Methanohalobium sp. TaxID=2837493 RepID=UPI0039785004
MNKKLAIKIILSLFIAALSKTANTQSQEDSLKQDTIISIDESLIEEAHKAYEDMAYKKAARLFEELIEQNYLDANIYQKLADAYYKTREIRQAEEYYKILVTSTIHRQKDVYNLVKVLKYSGKYEEAEKWLERYSKAQVNEHPLNSNMNLEEYANEIKSFPRHEIDTLPFNTEHSEFGPTIYQDYLYFTSPRKRDEIIEYKYPWDETNFLDVYKISLSHLDTTPEKISGKVNSKFHDGPVSFSKNGKDIYFSSNNKNLGFFPVRGKDKINHLKIFHAKIKNGKIKSLEELSFNSDEYSCSHPSVSKNSNIIYYTADKNDGYGGSDIYYSVKEGSGWSEPINAGKEINTEGDEMFPFIHESGTLYFASDGHPGLGGLDIFKAEKKNGEYEVENMGYPLNTRFDDFSIFVEENQKEGFFASNRKGGKGSDDIYKFRVTRDKRNNLVLKCIITDKETKETLDNTTVRLTDSDENKIQPANKVKNTQSILFYINPASNYTIKADHPEYFAKENVLKKSNLLSKTDTFEYKIALAKKPVWGIYGQIFDKENKEVIKNANIIVKNRLTSEQEKYQTNEEGKFKIKLEKNTDYNLIFEKEGYHTLKEEYYTRGREEGWINLNEIMDLIMEKIPEKEITFLTGKIKDKETREGVKAKIQLIDNEENKITATYLSGENGSFKIKLPEVKKYGVEITADDYLYFAEQVDFSALPAKNDSIKKDFNLEPIEVGKKVVIENIFFETGKAKLKPESYEALNKVVELLRNNKDLKLEIAGHTDNVGNYTTNKELSSSRAKSVVEYLVGHGIDESRLDHKGYSFKQPIAPNDTPEGRQKNRRVEFEILEK